MIYGQIRCFVIFAPTLDNLLLGLFMCYNHEQYLFSIVTKRRSCHINVKGSTGKHNTVWCRYNPVNFFPKYSPPYFARQGEVWGNFCGFSIWLIFCFISCNAVCNTMLYWTALSRHLTVASICTSTQFDVYVYNYIQVPFTDRCIWIRDIWI